MENLQKGLFQDPKLESKAPLQAGRPPCWSMIGGGSGCITGTGADISYDALP